MKLDFNEKETESLTCRVEPGETNIFDGTRMPWMGRQEL